MTTLTPTPKQQFLDANGNPLSGGKVYTYAAGTTTPLTTYTDQGGSTPNTNPVILDSRGEAAIWLGVASYKFKLTTSTDAEIWTVDNIVSASVQALANLSESGGSALVGYLPAGTGAVATTVQAKLRETVSVKDFGAKGDGVTDDTAAIQAFVNYLTTNHCYGYAPAGIYLISAKINFACTYGWGIIGAGQSATIFKQSTDNTPIFDLGVIASSYMHSYLLSDMSFDYVNSQPAANTSASPILFSEMGYEGNFQRLTFSKGCYAIKVKSGVGGPWGQCWDALNFGGSLTGGAMDWTGAVNAIPNNKWGRFLVTATNMTGPIFKAIKGYNWTWDALELLNGVNCQWIDCGAGSTLSLTAVKMELATYSGTNTFNGNSLMYFPSSYVQIGQIDIGGTSATFNTANALRLISNSSGSVFVRSLNTRLSAASTNFYLTSLSGGFSEITYVNRGTYPISDYTDVSGTVSSENLIVFPDLNTKMSGNKGDADYTIAAGDAAVIRFETTLTASRTVNLPADNSCFNGLRYRVISYGAVNGANTLVVKASGVTKATLTADKTFIEMEWRRNAVPHAGWLIVGAGTLP